MTPGRIKLIRDHLSLTQVKFSKFIMVNYETYRNWEEGRRISSSPGYTVLVIAEKCFEIFIKNRKDILKKFKQLY
jgi:DNA-binding transcriptional regulator YiaG